MEQEIKVVACNFLEATSECREGALAYVHNENRGNGSERIEVIARSRSGRWVTKWEAIWRLGNFRLKTMLPDTQCYHHNPATWLDEEWVDALNAISTLERGRRDGHQRLDFWETLWKVPIGDILAPEVCWVFAEGQEEFRFKHPDAGLLRRQSNGTWLRVE